jgi:hypothetical protein
MENYFQAANPPVAGIKRMLKRLFVDFLDANAAAGNGATSAIAIWESRIFFELASVDCRPD